MSLSTFAIEGVHWGEIAAERNGDFTWNVELEIKNRHTNILFSLWQSCLVLTSYLSYQQYQERQNKNSKCCFYWDFTSSQEAPRKNWFFFFLFFLWKHNWGTRGAQEQKIFTVTWQVAVPQLKYGNHPHMHIHCKYLVIPHSWYCIEI